MIKMR